MIKHSTREFDGWYANHPLDALFTEVSALQPPGDIAEIGVHQGKMFCSIVQLLRPGERALAIDLFENQDENVDNSGCGNRVKFEENLSRCVGPAWKEVVDVWAINSKVLIPSDFNGRKIRIFSIDGGHTSDYVLHDLEVAQHVMVEDMPLIVVDDYYHTGWHGVFQGTNHFLRRHGDAWKPVYVSPLYGGSNKLILTRAKDAEMLAKRLSGRYMNTYDGIKLPETKPVSDVSLPVYN